MEMISNALFRMMTIVQFAKAARNHMSLNPTLESPKSNVILNLLEIAFLDGDLK
jgi:hypothetical protein